APQAGKREPREVRRQGRRCRRQGRRRQEQGCQRGRRRLVITEVCGSLRGRPVEATVRSRLRREAMSTSDHDPDAAPAADAGLFGLPTKPEDARLVIVPVPWDATTSY